MHSPNEDDEDLLAVQEAIAEWHAGDAGVTLGQAIDQIRLDELHRLPRGERRQAGELADS